MRDKILFIALTGLWGVFLGFNLSSTLYSLQEGDLLWFVLSGGVSIYMLTACPKIVKLYGYIFKE